MSAINASRIIKSYNSLIDSNLDLLKLKNLDDKDRIQVQKDIIQLTKERNEFIEEN